MKMDTIAALATPHGVGSIAIVRLSGDNALAIATKLTVKKSLVPRYATLTMLQDSSNAPIDESIVIYFKAPHSFTAEDVIEFQCHGGLIVARMILETLLEYGARLAEPGEFTKRAYLNGRIDLTEAEAVADLIVAKSDDAAKVLARQLRGDLKNYVNSLRDKLTNILAYSEVSIDYAEEDLPQDLIDNMLEKVQSIQRELAITLEASKGRKQLMEGFRVAIVGKPNVGKSSLLNALLHFNRAIVSDIAGTTRDTIEEQLQVGTHLVRIIDTAGIRHSDDTIEKIGIERSRESVESADIVIALFDGSRTKDEEDDQILELLEQFSIKPIVLISKSDLEQKFDKSILSNFNAQPFSIEDDTTHLIKELEELMNVSNSSDALMLTNIRQVNAIERATESLELCKEPLQNVELEFFSFHINEAIASISSISQPYEYDEMLDKMFSNFCLGK